jgi:outer membrane protein OmpA-like peptidoglycan-associated protein
MLVAKGYGSAAPVAGNDSLEGRLRNRRIEYRVIKT